MTTKQQAFAGNPPKGSRKVGNNTFEYRDENGFRTIRLHRTDVVKFTDDGIKLSSGGWQTVTTKARMNEYLPAGIAVWQTDFEWYVATRAATGEWVDVPFYDGIVVRN